MRRFLVVLAAAAVAVSPLLARAADPANGTVSPTNPSVTWTGGPLASQAPAGQEGTSVDTFTLKVDIPAAYYKTNPRAAVRIRIDTTGGDDVDLTVTKVAKPQWSRVSQLRDGTHDQITLLRPPAGEYKVAVRPYQSNENAFKGTATLIQALDEAVAPASQIEFQKNTIVDPPTADVASKNTGEPSLAVDSKGRIFVVAPGNGVFVWRSLDGGKSFDFTGDFDADFLLGGGDSEIHIDKNDNIYIADLAVVSINVLKSTDQGTSFPQRAITGYESDRQWLATYGEKTVYLGYHDIGLETEIAFRSDDGGETFTQATVVQEATKPADFVDCFENTFSGPVAVDQKDETVYIVYGCGNVGNNVTSDGRPWGPANNVFVGVSRDRGVTFTTYPAMRFPAGANTGNLFPTMALDKAGNAYVVVAKSNVEGGPTDVVMSVSKDKGQTWSPPVVVNKAPGTHVFPWIAAGDAGKVDIVWAGTKANSANDLNAVWNIDMAQSLNALAPEPTFTQTRVSDHPIHTGQVCTAGIACVLGGDRSLLDFIEVQLDPKGYANIAWTENAEGARHVGFSRQVSGPSLYGSAVLGTKITKPVVKPVTKPSGGKLPATGVEDPRALAVMVLALAVLLARRVRWASH